MGVEVDALALMTDGLLCWPKVDGDGRQPPLRRLGAREIRALEEDPAGEAARVLMVHAAVAEAILELEANADAWLTGGACVENAPLAVKAWGRAPANVASRELIATRYLEAAALLRDGWRPRGWRAS
jgi:hypothetical protein